MARSEHSLEICVFLTYRKYPSHIFCYYLIYPLDVKQLLKFNLSKTELLIFFPLSLSAVFLIVVNQIHFLVAQAKILALFFTFVNTDPVGFFLKIYLESNHLLLSLSLFPSPQFIQPLYLSWSNVGFSNWLSCFNICHLQSNYHIAAIVVF